MKKALLILLIACMIGAGGWWWWNSRDSGDDGTLTLYGNVDIRQVALAFENTGRVTDMLVEEGDHVTAGQIIATLDTDILQLQAVQAEAEVEVQRQTLLQLRNGARPEEVTQARARLHAANAAATKADRDLARLTRLRDSGSGAVSTQTVQDATSAVETAQADVESASAALELIEAGARDEEIAAAEAGMEAAEASLDLLKLQIAQGALKAPQDAVIRSRLLEVGDMAAASTPAYTLAIVQPKWIRVYVDEPDLGRVRPGMSAQVFADSNPDAPVAGVVGYISSTAEFTPKSVQTEELRTNLVYETRIIVQDEAEMLRLGQPVTVRLAAGDAQ